MLHIPKHCTHTRNFTLPGGISSILVICGIGTEEDLTLDGITSTEEDRGPKSQWSLITNESSTDCILTRPIDLMSSCWSPLSIRVG